MPRPLFWPLLLPKDANASSDVRLTLSARRRHYASHGAERRRALCGECTASCSIQQAVVELCMYLKCCDCAVC